MAEDDGTIPLQVTIGDSAGQLQTLSDHLTKVFEGLTKVVEALDKVPGSTKELKAVQSQFSMIKQALAEPTPEIGLLNAVQKGARATATAVKEIDIQKLVSDTRQIANALRSADPERVKLAQQANQRLIDAAKLQIAELEQLSARAEGAEVKRLENQLTRLQQSLAASVAREERAVAQLDRLREQQRVQAGVQARERTQVVNEVFAQTPRGQEIASTRAMSDARLNANAENSNVDAVAASQRRQMLDDRLNAMAEDANLNEIQRTEKRKLEGDRLNAVAEEQNLQAIAQAEKRKLEDARLDAAYEEANRNAIEATRKRQLSDERLNAEAENANLSQIERVRRRELDGDRLNAVAEEANLQAIAATKKRELDEARLNASWEEANRNAIESTKRRELADERLNAEAENANLNAIEAAKKRELDEARRNAVAEEQNLQAIAATKRRELDEARLNATYEEANRQAITATQRRELMDARLNAVAENANLTAIQQTERRKLEGDRLNAIAEEANLQAIAATQKRMLDEARLSATWEEANRQAIVNSERRRMDEARRNAEAENRNFDQVRRAQGQPSTAQTNENYRQVHYDRLFGDGGAALFETQARLMLNYQALDLVMRGLRDAAESIVHFDNSLHEMQAVTGVTHTQIAELGKSILSLAADSKFSIKELMDSALEMAKSGLSLLEIQTSLEKIRTLAAATGTPMKEATELYVSALETFKVNTSEADKITEQLVMNLNSSRLNVEKLNLAFQGIGVTAKESGLGFAETTSALASLSNAGLTSGQQLSQGFRQVLVDLDAPNAKFAQRLRELNIPLSDVSVQSNGLIGVFENLKRGGFSAGDAFETLGARASTAFVALLNHTEDLKAQYQLTLQATGAMGAQATATDTLEAQWRRLSNAMTTWSVGGSSVVVGGLKGIAGGLADVSKGADGSSTATKAFFTILSGTVVAGAAKVLLTMVTNLRLVRDTMVEVTAAARTMTAAQETTTIASSGLLGALKGFGPTLIAGLGIAAVIYLIDQMGEKSGELEKKLDELKAKEIESKDAYEQKAKAIETVNEFLDSLIARNHRLQTDQDALNQAVLEAKNRFGNLGTAVDGLIPSYDNLITRVRQLRMEMHAAASIDIQNQINTLAEGTQVAQQQVAKLSGKEGLTKLLTKEGVVNKYPTFDDGIASPFNAGSTISELRNQGREGYNSNATAQRVLDFVSGDGHQSTEEANRLLQELSSGNTGLSPSTIKNFQETVNQITQGILTKIQNDTKTVPLQTSLRVQNMEGTSGAQTANTIVDRIATTLGSSKDFDAIKSAKEKEARLDAVLSEIEPQIQELQHYKASLGTAEARSDFDKTDAGSKLISLTAQAQQITKSVNTFAAEVATKTMELAVTTLSRQISEAQAELTHSSKMGHKDADVQKRIEDLALQRRNLEDKITAAKLDKSQEDGKGAATDPNLRDATAREEAAAHQATYNQTVNRADWTGDKKGIVKRDINTPIPFPAEHYGSELSHEMGLIDKNATNQINQTNIPTKADEAFLNAAGSSDDYPRAVLDLRKQQLGQAKTAAMPEQLQIRLQQLQSLQQLQVEADAMLQKNNDDFQKVAWKYGINVSEAGQIDATHFSNDAKGSQQHSDFKAAYETYMKNLRAIPDEKDKVQAEIERVNTDVDTLKAKIQARTDTQEGDWGKAYGAANFEFDKTNSLLPGQAFKNQTETISSLMNGMSSSTANFFTGLVSGSAKGKNAFSDFARSIVADALKIASQKAASALLGQMFNLGMSAIGGLTGGGSSTPDAGSTFASYTGTDTGGTALTTNNMLGRAYVGGTVQEDGTIAHFYQGGTNPGTYKETHKRMPHHGQRMVIPKFDMGGLIPGADLGRDSVHALVAPGESILNRGATSLVGSDMINAMNRGAIIKQGSMPQAPAPKQPDMVNVYVVDKTTPPPQPGPRDMVAAITDDILTGGQTRKLIRSVAMGNI